MKLIFQYIIIVSLIQVIQGSWLYALTASGKTYYVDAVNGNDNNKGNQHDVPYKTINKAASMAKAGDTICIGKGIYREEVKLLNSGTPGKYITIKPYQNEEVTLSCTRPVNAEWSRYKDEIYKAHVRLELGSKNNVWVDGNQAHLARWPNVKDNLYGQKFERAGQGTNDTTIINSDIPDVDWTGATICIFDSWVIYSGKVKGSDENSIFFKNNAPFSYLSAKKGSLFYLIDKLEALDQENEWYYDERNETLYLYQPGGGNPGNSRIEVASGTCAFDLNGRSFIQIQGINLFGANITMKGSNNCILDGVNGHSMKYISNDINCENGLRSQDHTGIQIEGNDNLITNYEISGSSGNGIVLRGDRNRIINNYIHNVNTTGTYSGALNIYGRNNHVAYNTMSFSGRYLVQLGAKQSIFEFNDISDGMYLSNDGGLVYCYHLDGEGTEFRNNWLHNTHSLLGQAPGLYIDNSSCNFLVYHNAFWGIESGAVALNPPSNYNLVYENVIDGHIESISNDMFIYNESYGSRVTDNVVSQKFRIDTYPPPFMNGNVVSEKPDRFAYGVPGHNFSTKPVLQHFQMTDNQFENQLKDGCFLDKNLTFWTKTDAKNAFFQQGKGEILARGTESSVRLGTGVDGIVQEVTTLIPGADYQFCIWVKIPEGENVEVGVKDFGGQPVSTSHGFTNDQWIRMVVQFTAVSDKATVFAKKISQGAGYCYCDEAGLVNVSDGAFPLSILNSPKPIANLPNSTIGLVNSIPRDYVYQKDYSAPKASIITIDGVVGDGEWDKAGELFISSKTPGADPPYGTPPLPDRLFCSYRFMWDNQYLYIAETRNDVSLAYTEEIEHDLWKCDATILWLKADSGKDMENRENLFDFWYSASSPQHRPLIGLREVMASNSVLPFSESVIAATVKESVAITEIAIPLTKVRARGIAGTKFAFAFAIPSLDLTDNGKISRSQINWVNGGFENPIDWARLTFVNE